MLKIIAVLCVFSLQAERVEWGVRDSIRHEIRNAGVLPEGRVMTSRSTTPVEFESAVFQAKELAENIYGTYDLSMGFGRGELACGAHEEPFSMAVCSLFNGSEHFVGISQKSDVDAAKMAILAYEATLP